MSLGDVMAPADQKFKLCVDVCGELEYPVHATKFSGVLACTHTVTDAGISHLCLYIPPSVGGGCTRIYYIGLRGKHLPLMSRQQIITAVYETNPMSQVHKGG
jgi:hypothetical protein